MFTLGPVHGRDHGPEHFIAGVQNWLRGLHKGLIVCPFKMVP